MNKHLLTLLIICLGIFLPQVVLGDTVPTEGTWGKERYRTIIPNPPTVSIDGNLLSIHCIYEIISKELEEGRSWLRIRNQAPCNTCLYQWFCPSPSNYEIAIGRPNLCHVK